MTDPLTSPTAGGAHTHQSTDIVDLEATIRAIVAELLPDPAPPPPDPEPDPEPAYRWPRPTLDNPLIVSPPPIGKQTITIPNNRDAVIVCPEGGRAGATIISGGRHVVIDGGRWNVEADLPIPNQVGGVDDSRYRVFTCTGQTGELWMANILCDNPTNRHHDFLAGGGNVWTLQNIRAVNQRGKAQGWHADFAQPWNSLQLLRVDRLTLSTNYQGFYFYGGNRPVRYDLRRCDLHHVAYPGLPRQSSLFWTNGTTNGEMDQVYADTSGRPIDGSRGPARWIEGTPPGGEFVP